MIFIYLAKMVFEFIRMKWGHIPGVRMEYDMREVIFRHIQKLSFNYFDSTKAGHIMSRISNDLNTIAEVALSRLSVTADMLVSIGEEMMDESFTGMPVLQDTVSIDLSLYSPVKSTPWLF